MAVPAEPYYGKYHGHKTTYLAAVEAALRADGGPDAAVAWLVGDSSLDNKFWLGQALEPAVNGMERVLEPPVSRPDVCHYVNKAAAARGAAVKCVNCAIEESRIASRSHSAFPAQDKFCRDHLRPQDTLIVSVGGNDIALAPSCCTALNMATLLCCCPTKALESAAG